MKSYEVTVFFRRDDSRPILLKGGSYETRKHAESVAEDLRRSLGDKHSVRVFEIISTIL